MSTTWPIVVDHDADVASRFGRVVLASQVRRVVQQRGVRCAALQTGRRRWRPISVVAGLKWAGRPRFVAGTLQRR